MSKPSEWGKPPFRYMMVGDSDGETVGYDHMVYDADGEELTNAPNERVGRLFAASSDLYDALTRLCRAWYKATVNDEHPAIVAAEAALAKASGA